MKKKIIIGIVLLIVLVFVWLVMGVGKNDIESLEKNISKIELSGDLVTLKTYYHNVAEVQKEAGTGIAHWFEKDRKLWIEYQSSGYSLSGGNGMSFSGNVKDELAGHLSAARHCHIAELAAILQFCGTIVRKETGEAVLCIETENESVSKKCFTLLRKTFNIETTVWKSDEKCQKNLEHSTI